ncbi:MAG TPA: c-type cytochrome [Sphingomicrobium sp.]|nr:c-type cytochrome [Sphingomicrobium sp.]
MARKPASTRASDKRTPAGAPPSRQTIDRPWRIWATLVVVFALVVAGLLGFVIVPAGQRENAGLSMGHAMRRAAGLEAGSPAVAQPVSTASAIPVSSVSWDPQIMRILAAGSSRRGAAVAAESCVACHGEKGISQSLGEGPVFPSLAGQTAHAIYKQLHDFRSGARVNEQMTPLAQSLSEADLAAVAAFYSEASKEYAALGSRAYVGEPHIDRLAREGDSRRRIPACLACHVNGAGGPIETPVITGQRKDYIRQQLDAFATGARKNDVYGRMRDISAKLTPEEREQLARYFEGTI